MRAWSRAVVAAALCLGGSSGVVHAQPPRTSSLSWVRLPGAESCISTQHLAAAVEKRIGRRAFVSASQADISVEGRVERLREGNATRWKATLIVSDRQGQILGKRPPLYAEGEDCSVLDRSLVLVVAIAIDPGVTIPSVLGPGDALSEDAQTLLEQLDLPEADERTQLEQLAAPDTRKRESARTQARASAPSTAASSAPQEPQRAPAVAPPPPELQLGLGAQLQGGALPSAAFGGALLLAYLPTPRLGAELELDASLPVERAAAGGTAELSLRRAGLAGCLGAGPWASLSARLCAGAALGLLLTGTADFVQERQDTRAWAEARLGLRAVLALDPLLLHLGLRAELPITRDRLRYEGSDGIERTLHRAPAVTASGQLGLGVRFR